MGIEAVLKVLTLGAGDETDAERLKIAVASNIGGAPLTKEDRKRIAQVLYGDHTWTMDRIAKIIGGRPKGSGMWTGGTVSVLQAAKPTKPVTPQALPPPAPQDHPPAPPDPPAPNLVVSDPAAAMCATLRSAKQELTGMSQTAVLASPRRKEAIGHARWLLEWLRPFSLKIEDDGPLETRLPSSVKLEVRHRRLPTRRRRQAKQRTD